MMKSRWLLLALLGLALVGAAPRSRRGAAQEAASSPPAPDNPEAAEAPAVPEKLGREEGREEFNVPQEILDREKERELRREERMRKYMERDMERDKRKNKQTEEKNSRDLSNEKKRWERDSRMKNLPWTLETDEEKAKTFAEADTNKDKKVTEEEFKAFLLKPLEAAYQKDLERAKYGYPGARSAMRRRDMVRGDEEDEMDARELERFKQMNEERMAKMDEKQKQKVLEKQARYEEKWAKRAEHDKERDIRNIVRLYPRIDKDGDGITLKEWTEA
mmetsp:Transcript_9614/g.22178  ORF Transcript_9614/g.22178 Transcript_9614/m.22178 type:complete len:275 (+) Transcript_9614:52-876(+)